MGNTSTRIKEGVGITGTQSHLTLGTNNADNKFRVHCLHSLHDWWGNAVSAIDIVAKKL